MSYSSKSSSCIGLCDCPEYFLIGAAHAGGGGLINSAILSVMPRSIQVTLSPELADSLVERLRSTEGVVGLARTRGSSIEPPGDQIVILTNNEASRNVFAALEKMGVGHLGGVLTTNPSCLISPNHQSQIEPESNETVWEEMSTMLQQDSNIGLNFLVLMGFAGAVAAAGLWGDALHLVIGAMVIAPAFEPLIRIPFGLIAGPPTIVKRGLVGIFWGYVMLAAGGLLATLVLQAIDPDTAVSLTELRWVQYWSSFSPAGALASVVGAAGGAIVVCGLRSVLTTGVMITMALIPSMALVGMGAATGNLDLARKGFVRWMVDAGLVLLVGGVVFGLKQALLHRRRAWHLP